MFDDAVKMFDLALRINPNDHYTYYQTGVEI